MIEINKIKPMKVNNYKELSNALKQFFIEHVLSNNYEMMIDYCNKVINENNIISMACDEYLGDFISSYNILFCDQNRHFDKFFNRVGSGNLIKCNFPAIVTPTGIIEMSDILPIENYESQEIKDFFYDNYSLDEISNKMKKDVFVYIGTSDGCFNPIKKTKEEVIDFIKKNKVSFLKKYNDWRPIKSKKIFVGSYITRLSFRCQDRMVYFSNTAKNDAIKEINQILL